MKRVLGIGLLGISLVVLNANDASARLQCYKLPNGSCMWVNVGSIECGMTATGVHTGEILACTAVATDNWAVVCGNPGGNTWTAPGVNVVEFDGIFTGDYVVTGSDVDRNGKASVIVSNEPPQTLLEALEDAGACPNDLWEAVDAVPCEMNVQYKKYDAFDCLEEDLWLHCSTDCSTLEWDSVANSFVPRAYDCEITSTNKYRTPICPTSP